MHYFLDPTFEAKKAYLNEDESRHAIKSLRIRVGDAIEIGDGNGKRYKCEVADLKKDRVEVSVLETVKSVIPGQQLYIAMAPTKNISRFEWFLEKSTEMGISGIIPMETKRTERPRLKQERAERIVHAAAKQSLQPYIPNLQPLTPFEEVLESNAEYKFIAHCEETDDRILLNRAIAAINEEGDCLILIGPEGDFTSEEVNAAKEKGFKAVDLGEHRLRTETAGVFCAAIWLGRE